jgi:hypothetical protein
MNKQNLQEYYESVGTLYDDITKVEVGDNLKMNPFKVVMHLQELYNRIEQLEEKTK